MTAASVGSVHLDRASGRLLVNGVPVCRGCARPSDARFCGHVCEVKHSAEMRFLRLRLLPILAWAQMPQSARVITLGRPW
jgi:hypothetical protein